MVAGYLFTGFSVVAVTPALTGTIFATTSETAQITATVTLTGYINPSSLGLITVPVSVTGGSAKVAQTGVIAVTPVLSGFLGSSPSIVGTIQVTPTLTGLIGYVYSRPLTAFVTLSGDLKLTEAYRFTPSERKEELGYRPITPLLVKAVDVETEADLDAANVDVGDLFVISNNFVGGPGDLFYDSGAKPGSIGQKVEKPNPGILYVFRDGAPYEVVWHVAVDGGTYTDLGFYRWEEDAWFAYRTLPQRALDGQYATTVLDPDKIYDYYARLLGAMMAMLQGDNQELLTLSDPDTAPVETLPFLASQFGLTLNVAESEDIQRERIKAAIPTYEKKGLADAVDLRLRAVGYRGDPYEVWVDPLNPSNYTDDATGEKGTDWIEIVHGSRILAPQRSFSLYGDVNPVVGDVVIVSDFYATETFEFTAGGGAGPGNIEVVIGATAADTVAALIAAVNGSALAVTATEDTLADYPTMLLSTGKIYSDVHTAVVRNGYVPSSRVTVHIRRFDGTAVVMDRPQEELDEIKEAVARELRRDVLPVYVDIRAYATDLEVGGVPETGEALEISDELALIEVAP
jgi:phage tail P2-like protein